MPTIINLSGITVNVGPSTFNSQQIDGLQVFNNKFIALPEVMNSSVQNFVWGFTSQTTQIDGDSDWIPSGNTFPEDVTNPTDVDIYNMGVYPDNYPDDSFGAVALTYFGWNQATGWMESWKNGQDAILSTAGKWKEVTFQTVTADQLPAKGHNLSSGDAIDSGVSNSTGAKRAPAVLTPFDPDNFNPPANPDGYDNTFKHLYKETSTTNSRLRFNVTRTPRRMFTHADDTTRKYFGFHYHANLDPNDAARMAFHMEETYLGTARNFVGGIYASANPKANHSSDDLVFIGGVGLGDLQYFEDSSGNTGTGNAMNTPFRAKVLEIPNSIENPALWGDSNTPNGGSDPSQAQSGTFGLYFYIVSPPNESNYEGDITYDNFACQEWVVRPSSIEQLRLDSDDFYDELINGSIDGGGSN